MGSNLISAKFGCWEKELFNDCDKDFILSGIKSGFKITKLKGLDLVTKVKTKNHKSCNEHSVLVEKELLSQIDQGNYIRSSIPPLVVSPIGAIKKEGIEEVRIIHDGSHPVGAAMNDYGCSQLVKYQTLSDACELSKPGYFLAKSGLKISI